MSTVQQDLKSYQMYIAGQWTSAESGETYEVVDPSTERPFAVVPKGGLADAKRAVAAARKAFDEGPWPHTLATERAELLHAVAARIREHADELAMLETRQMGKLLGDSLIDVNDAAHTFDYYAGLAVEQHGQTLEVPGESMSMVVREPVGVTAGITPWNFPHADGRLEVRAGLAAGNVMIFKPASVSPLTVARAGPDLRRGGPARGRLPGADRPRRRRSATISRRRPTSTWWPSRAASRSARTSCGRAPRT